MAITIVQQPYSRVTPTAGSATAAVLFSRSKLVTTVSSNNISQPNFKYLFQLEENGSQIFESYVSPNPAGDAMFDFSPIVRNRMQAPIQEDNQNTFSIHQAKDNDIETTKCPNNQNIYTLKFGEVYEVDGVLTEFTNLTNFTRLIINGVQDYKDFYSTNGGVVQELIQYSTAFSAPILSQKGFLSKVNDQTFSSLPNNEYYRKLALGSNLKCVATPTRVTDLGRLAWIHDDIYIGNESYSLKYTWFNASNVALVNTIIDLELAANGGQALDSTDATGKVLAAPCHWGSMSQNVGTLIGAYTNALAWEHYTIQLLKSDGNPANYPWVFYKECSGNKNELYQLAWTNGVGFWDYYTFTPKAEHEESVEKKQYSTNVGSYSSANFKIFKYEASTKNYQITPKRSWTLASGKIDENLSMYLKDILKARQVQLIGPDGSILPVIVDTNSTKFFKDRTNNLYDFQIKVTLAQSLEA